MTSCGRSKTGDRFTVIVRRLAIPGSFSESRFEGQTARNAAAFLAVWPSNRDSEKLPGIAKRRTITVNRSPVFDLPHDVIVAILIALALTFCAICLFAWYLRRKYGARGPRLSDREVRSRKRRGKVTKRRK